MEIKDLKNAKIKDLFKFRAEDGTQTRDPQLGRFKRFTYESNCYAFLYAECLFLFNRSSFMLDDRIIF